MTAALSLQAMGVRGFEAAWTALQAAFREHDVRNGVAQDPNMLFHIVSLIEATRPGEDRVPEQRLQSLDPHLVKRVILG